MLIRRAIERGLAITDLEMMTLGMLMDYLITCANEDDQQEGNTKRATADDVEAF